MVEWLSVLSSPREAQISGQPCFQISVPPRSGQIKVSVLSESHSMMAEPCAGDPKMATGCSRAFRREESIRWSRMWNSGSCSCGCGGKTVSATDLSNESRPWPQRITCLRRVRSSWSRAWASRPEASRRSRLVTSTACITWIGTRTRNTSTRW